MVKEHVPFSLDCWQVSAMIKGLVNFQTWLKYTFIAQLLQIGIFFAYSF